MIYTRRQNMKSYYDLIKEGLIDFGSNLLDNYAKLGLNEVECLIIYKLYQVSKNNTQLLNLEELSKKMSLDVDTLGNNITSLVNKGFLELKADETEDTFKEEFFIDLTIKELAYYLENGDKIQVIDETGEKVKNTITELERILNKALSFYEMQVVNKWFYEYKYDYSLIQEELKKLSSVKFPNVNLLERNLKASSNNEITESDLQKLQNALKKKYGNQ